MLADVAADSRRGCLWSSQEPSTPLGSTPPRHHSTSPQRGCCVFAADDVPSEGTHECPHRSKVCIVPCGRCLTHRTTAQIFPPLKFKYAPWYFLIDSFETDNKAIPKYARGQAAGAAPAHRSPRRQRSHGSGAPLSHPPFPPNTGHTQRGWLANVLSDVASTFPSFPLQHYPRIYFSCVLPQT